MHQSDAERNRATTVQLRALVNRLSPIDLETPLGEGWTVKVALAHMAFWDRLAVSFLEEWRRTRVRPVLEHGEDLHLNRVCTRDWLAVPAAYAVEEALEAATLADQQAEHVDDKLRSAIFAAGESFACQRFNHRTEHLTQIERALSRRP